jgi:hypothetical protein
MRPISVEFLTELDTRLLHHPPPWANPDRAFALLSPFRIKIGECQVIEIPVGFITDFASIPVPWRNIISPTHAKLSRPAVLHDFSYAVGFRDSRLICDSLLWQGMVTEGAHPIMREVVYAGVRIGGWVAWNRYREQSSLELQKCLGGLHPPHLHVSVANWNRNLDGLA